MPDAMKNILFPVIFLAVAAGLSPGASPPVMTRAQQEALTPRDALSRLKEGNDRFVAGHPARKNLIEEARMTAAGQYPFAAIVCCLDSRAAPELIFDQGIGDVFCARVAGNVLNNDILGSLEYACKVAGAKLIVVVGHRSCGAVKGAVDRVRLGKLTGLLAQIEPAVTAAMREVGGGRSSHNSALVDRAALDNVILQMRAIPRKSKILKSLLDSGQIAIIGAFHDLRTGRVTFLGSD
jgi:carbonic anhydrase